MPRWAIPALTFTVIGVVFAGVNMFGVFIVLKHVSSPSLGLLDMGGLNAVALIAVSVGLSSLVNYLERRRR